MDDILLDVIQLYIQQKNWTDLYTCACTTRDNLTFVRSAFKKSIGEDELNALNALSDMIKSSVDNDDEEDTISMICLISDDDVRDPVLISAAEFAIPGACARAKPKLLAVLIKRFNVDIAANKLVLDRAFERFIWQFQRKYVSQPTIIMLGRVLLAYGGRDVKIQMLDYREFYKKTLFTYSETHNPKDRCAMMNAILGVLPL